MWSDVIQNDIKKTGISEEVKEDRLKWYLKTRVDMEIKQKKI